MKKMLTARNIVLGIGIILIDLAVYIILGILFMNYEDFYDESEGPYYSLESMTISEKCIYIGLHIWGLINLFFVGFVIFKFFKKRSNTSGQDAKLPH